MLKLLNAALLATVAVFGAGAQSQASAILVGQCVESTTCFTSTTPTPWSHMLTGADLTSLGLGTTQPFVAAQTSQFVIRLGITTITFDTNGGPVIEMLPVFNGSFHTDPCNFCEVDTVGMLSIPGNATDATISGTFGNSVQPGSAGVNLCLGAGPPCAAVADIAEPASLSLLGVGLAGLSLIWFQRKAGRLRSRAT
jgi:hypothetical protein